jgi:hypothetical protein
VMRSFYGHTSFDDGPDTVEDGDGSGVTILRLP